MKKLRLDLEDPGANNIMILLVFEREAMKQNWTLEEIDNVLKEAKGRSYDHILRTLKKHCESPKNKIIKTKKEPWLLAH